MSRDANNLGNMFSFENIIRFIASNYKNDNSLNSNTGDAANSTVSQ